MGGMAAYHETTLSPPMSHDITLYEAPKKNIVVLSRSMGSSHIHEFYESIRCTHANNGVSGDGSLWILSDETVIRDALELWERRGEKDFANFLQNVLMEMRKNGKVLLQFS